MTRQEFERFLYRMAYAAHSAYKSDDVPWTVGEAEIALEMRTKIMAEYDRLVGTIQNKDVALEAYRAELAAENAWKIRYRDLAHEFEAERNALKSKFDSLDQAGFAEFISAEKVKAENARLHTELERCRSGEQS